MLIDDPPSITPPLPPSSPLSLTEQSLSSLRNSLIGSFDTKVYHIQTPTFKTLLTTFTTDSLRSSLPLPVQNLLISILNSYIISHKELTSLHPEFQKEHAEQYSLLAPCIMKTLSQLPLQSDTHFLYESALRLLANLNLQNLFTFDQSFMSFLSGIDKLIVNNTLLYSICILLSNLCQNAYYTNIISQNEPLITKLISKFYETASSTSINLLLNKQLMNIIVSLTENEDTFCHKLLSYPSKHQQHQSTPFVAVLTKGIRLFDMELRFLYIKLLTNILIYLKKDASASAQAQPAQTDDAKASLMDDPITLWSISILLSMLTQSVKIEIEMKVQCVTALCNLLKLSVEFQSKFLHLNGVDIVSKELREMYTEAEMKEVGERTKALKANKGKKHEKVENDDSIISIDSPCEVRTRYKSVLIECLAQASALKEEARVRIADSKELCIYIDILSDTGNHSSLLLATALLFLSLSRGNISIKKTLMDYDITHLLFRLSAHPKVDVQIQSTSSLCNFLLENSNSNSNAEVLECVVRLLKIFKTTTHKKIRVNAVFALKNILYSLNSNFEMKKSVMKKITYETLLALLDDGDKVVQVQALHMFRVLLFKSSEDIEEVFVHCKEKLMASLLMKLSEGGVNSEVVVHSLYVLSNVSSGNNKHKTAIGKEFVDRIIRFAYVKNANVRLVCVTILNNLMTDVEVRKGLVEVEGFVPLLEKIVFEGKEKKEEEGGRKGSVGDNGGMMVITAGSGGDGNGGDVVERGNEEEEEDNDDERGEFADAKKMAMGMLAMIKNMKKEKS